MSLQNQLSIIFAIALMPTVLMFISLVISVNFIINSKFLLLFLVIISLVCSLFTATIGIRIFVIKPFQELGIYVNYWNKIILNSKEKNQETALFNFKLMLAFLHQTTKILERQQADLRMATEQQGLLMQEIHHRVKNNLQIVASLMNLQASRIQQPEAKAEFQSARDRIRALATLHRHLYTQGELHTINMRGFLVELCGQLFHAMGENIGERIKLQIVAPELQILSDQAVPMSLIVTEAVSNAIKYAFPAGRHGSISVCLVSNGDDAELSIIDDGVGIPQGRVDTDSGPRDGIGIILIRGFARQLGATLTVEEGGGTRYFIRMRLSQAMAKRGTSTEGF